MNNLQKYRNIAGLTQTELSDAIGAHKDYINRIETYHFKPGKIYRYAIIHALNQKYIELDIPIKVTIEDLIN